MSAHAFPCRKAAIAFCLLLLFIGFSKRALASGDFGCSAKWKLVHHEYEGCSNMAGLTPANDTRVNLLLLMADLHAAGKTAPDSASKPDSPLFTWDMLADRLGTQADKAASQSAEKFAQDNQNKCPPMLSPDDLFAGAVQADRGLTAEEREALLAARKAMQPNCPGDAADNAIATAVKTAKTASGKAFAHYLQGAASFWQGDYGKAASTFTELVVSKNPWIKEVAIYMLGRTLINRAQAGAFDEYGAFKQGWKADAALIAAAESALDNYLHLYPKGAYAQSARGLKRRGYWMGGDIGKLEDEYGMLLSMAPEDRNTSDIDLAQEIDNKLFTPPFSLSNTQDELSLANLLKGTHNPMMLAAIDLYDMRTLETAENKSKPITIEELQAQKPSFAGQMPLYEYLLAAHAFYVEKKPADVLRIIPDAARQASFSYLQFSRQMLRGMALEDLKDHNALGFWTQMLHGARAPYERAALELAIAYHDERTGEVQNVFSADSPVHFPYLREVLLTNIADASLLRKQAKAISVPKHERDIALYTLLYKEATRGDAAAFLQDLALVLSGAPGEGYFALDDTSSEPQPIPLGVFTLGKIGGSFGCLSLRETEAQLVRDANNPTAHLCVADFIRTKGGPIYALNAQSLSDELGGTPSLFPGGDFVRMNTYTSVIASSKASANDKAYALFRAVNCYAPSGSNDCGGKDVPIAQRKAWFQSLKRDYPNSQWAKELQYYW